MAFDVDVYIALVLVMVGCENRLAFPGWTIHRARLAPPAGVIVDEVSITTPDGNVIQAWWLPPNEWTPDKGAVLYMHGNGENVSTCGKALRNWRNELQTAVLGFDYPGYGRSTGTPDEGSCYTAAQSAFDWLTREKKVPAQSIVVIGQVNRGAAVATEIAHRQRCRMLVTSGAFTSFPDIAEDCYFWLPARYLVRLRFDNLAKMRELDTPVFITYGTADHAASLFSHGERLSLAVVRKATEAILCDARTRLFTTGRLRSFMRWSGSF